MIFMKIEVWGKKLECFGGVDVYEICVNMKSFNPIGKGG
jgi:hypothetical protein